MDKSTILKKLLNTKKNRGKISDIEILKKIHETCPNLNNLENEFYFKDSILFPDDDVRLIKISDGWIVSINGYEKYVVNELCEIFHNNDDILRKYINDKGKKYIKNHGCHFGFCCDLIIKCVKEKMAKNLKNSFCDLNSIREDKEVFFHDDKDNYEKVLIKPYDDKWLIVKDGVEIFKMDKNFNIEENF